MATVDTHNTISSIELANIITTSAKALIENPELAEAIPPVLVRGGAGVGKSTIVKTCAKELGIGFIDIRLAQMERVDLCGLPSVENGLTKWNVPAIFPTDENSSGILFLDEITAAPADVQVAAYSLILDRRIPNTNYVLPKKWLIVAAGNRTTDRAVAKMMSSALANRFAHYELEANAEHWVNWAVANNIHPSVTGFINYKPTLLFKMDGQNLECGWPSPRSWQRVSNVLSLFGSSEDVLRKVVYGLVGQGVGCEFVEFHRIQKKFDSVLEMLRNPKAKISIPTRSDEKHAFCSAVIYHVWSGDTAAEDKKRVEGMFRIVNELSADFAAMVIKAVTFGNKRVSRIEALKMIMLSKEYAAFQSKFGKSMSEKFSLDLSAVA